MNRGQRLVKRFRDFFSEMERGRILLLGVIACVMLCQFALNEVEFMIAADSGFDIGLYHPELYMYLIGIGILVYCLLKTHRKMREKGETMTSMHLRELALIVFVLFLLDLPMLIVSINELPGYISGPEPWEDEYTNMLRFLGYINMISWTMLYLIIGLFAWRKFKRMPSSNTVRLALDRVLALTVIVSVIVTTRTIYSYGWLRFDQIYGWSRETEWFSDIVGSYWFYLNMTILCIVMVYLGQNWFRMRKTGTAITQGQFQELAVISFGLLLINLPWFIDFFIDYIDINILSEQYGSDSDFSRALDTQTFYLMVSAVFEVLAYLVLGLFALKRYKSNRSIEGRNAISIDPGVRSPPKD